MPYFPVIQKYGQLPASMLQRQLPEFYMQDFSIIGLQVSDCDRAMMILDQHDFPLKQFPDAVEVAIDGPLRMHEAITLLRESGLDCEIADVAEGIYQG